MVRNLIKKQILEGDKVYLIGRKEEKSILESFKDKFQCNIEFFKTKKSKIPQIVKGKNLNKFYKKIVSENIGSQVVLIVHCVGAIGLFGCCPRNTFVVLHGHESTKGILSNIFYKILFFKLRKNCSFISCSEECGNYYWKKYKLKSKIIQNGINTEGIKNEYYPHKRSFNICMMSNLDEHKGLQFFVEAAGILSKKQINVHFFAIGNNSSGYDFQKSIEQLGMEKTFTYLGRVNDSANKILPFMDLLVLPSKMEGLPMSLIEAQSYGIPILATKVGGIPEILTDGVNGFFIERDGQDIANKIEKCLKDETYQQLSKNSIDTYRSNFTAERMCNDYEKFCTLNNYD